MLPETGGADNEQTIIDQVNRDDSIRSLLKMDEVYTFLTGEDLRRIESMKSVVECTHQALVFLFLLEKREIPYVAL
jgi:hypothetical protein